MKASSVLLSLTAAAYSLAAAPQDISAGAGKPLAFHKGEIHMHTTRSDGDATPLQAAGIYRDKGFDFCIFTDHLVDWCYGGWFDPADFLGDRMPGFTGIAGNELSTDFPATAERACWVVHVNALGAKWPIMPATPTDAETALRRNIRAAWDAGAVAQVNHPNFCWSFDYRELSKIEEPFLMELANMDPFCYNSGDLSRPSVEYNWDILLSRGMKIWGTATDDAHYYYDYQPATSSPGYGWVVCMTEDLSEPAILNALRLGRFYASTGPELESYEVKGRTISIKVKPRNGMNYRIKFIGKNGVVLKEADGLEAEYKIRGDEKYVRARVSDDAGGTNRNTAGNYASVLWCQPVFVDEIEGSEVFAAAAEDFASRAKNAALAVKFGGKAENFTSVYADTKAENGVPGWENTDYLENGPTLLPGLSPVQRGYTGGDLPATLLFRLPAGDYRATLLTGESGSRVYSSADLEVEINHRKVLSGLDTRSGCFLLNSFDFSSDGKTASRLTFRPCRRWGDNYFHSPWSAAALIVEKIDRPKATGNAIADFTAPDAAAAGRLAPGLTAEVTLTAYNPTSKARKLTLEIVPESAMARYFKVSPPQSFDTAPGATATARFTVEMRCDFDLKQVMKNIVVGCEYVPVPPFARFHARLTADSRTVDGLLVLPVERPKLSARLAEGDADNRFAVSIDDPGPWHYRVALPEGWTVNHPEGIMDGTLTLDFTEKSTHPAGDLPAVITLKRGEAELSTQVALRTRGTVLEVPGEIAPGTSFEIPNRITRGLTVEFSFRVDEFGEGGDLVMFRRQKYSEFQIYCKADGTVNLRLEDSVDNYHDRVEAFGPKLEAGREYRLRLEWDKYRGGTLYIDGKPAAQLFGDFDTVDLMDNSAPLVAGGKLKAMIRDLEVANYTVQK
ncbi:MAG: CehA/McbA family metallohydrolase [Victivallaceae bacterium]